MNKTWRRPAQIAAGFLISAFFLWLAFRNADLGRVMVTLRHTDLWLVAAAFVLSLLGLALRSYRWKLLGDSYRGTPWHFFFRATSIGLMLNMFLPFRSGDLFQAYFISRGGRFSRSYALATVVLERLVDTISPLLMLIGGSLFVVMPEAVSLPKILAFFGALAAGIVLFIRQAERISAFAGRFGWLGYREKVVRLLGTLAGSLSFMKSRQVLFKALPITFFNWFVITIVSTWSLLYAVDIRLTFLQVIVVQGIMVISVAIPASPGYIGTWEFFTVLALGVFGVDRDQALSFAILTHFMSFLPVTLAGISVLACESMLKKDRQDIEAIRRTLS